MIHSFKHKGLEEFYRGGSGRRLPTDMRDRINDILTTLRFAKTLDDLSRPAFKLHPLKGSLTGYWSVTVSANWRIIFRFAKGIATDVDFIDYH